MPSTSSLLVAVVVDATVQVAERVAIARP